MAKAKKITPKTSKKSQKKTTAAKQARRKTQAAAKKTVSKTSTKTASKKQTSSTNKTQMKKDKSSLAKVNPVEKIKKLEPIQPVFNKQTKIILAVVLLVGLAYIFRGQFIAAMVNGQPIWRLKVIREAEQAQGPQVLENLVMEALIEQKAKVQGVVIPDEAVIAQIEEIKQNVTEQGQDFDQLLAMQGLSMSELQRQIRIQQMVEVMAMSDVEITDEAVAEFIEENRDFLPEDSTEEELEEMARQQLENQQMSQQYQEWVTNLKEEANIQYLVGYGQEDSLGF